MAIPRHFVDAVIKDKGWKPYIKGHWMMLGSKSRGGVIITFKDHEQHEYKCSYKTATEIINSAKVTRQQ
uniref:Uncharacterized protein n=1 Tax=viral metagenome TaxID=1070528 RepID=A0A6M3Y3Z5_9ZZZZ